MEIDDLIEKVNLLVDKEKPPFIFHVDKSSTRPYIFLYMNGNNHLDYEFKDGEWVIRLDLNYGHRKELGKIKSYKGDVVYKDIWKDIPKPIQKFIEELNKIFKESLKSQSIKFITSKVNKFMNRKNMTLYRSDNDSNFSITSVRMSLERYKLEQFMHKPEQIMTYLKGVFATPEKEYAEKYPQDNIYSFEVEGNFLTLPKDASKIKGETLMDASNWIKDNYDGVIGINAADTNFGKFDEVVIFDKHKIKKIKKIKK